jgi:hypothetical protein
VMAHEIAHRLLPQQEHTDARLIRGRWSAHDLRIGGSARLGLPARSAQFMERQALRRVLSVWGHSKLGIVPVRKYCELQERTFDTGCTTI